MADQILQILQDFLVAPHWYPLVPLVGFVVIAATSVGLSSADYADDRQTSSAAWPAPAALSLALLCVLCALGKYSGGAVPLVAYTVLAAVCTLVSANRGLVRTWVADGGPLATIIRDVAVLVVATLATVTALEVSWNTSFPALAPISLAIELGLAAGIICSLYFIGQRSGALAWIAVLLAGLAGVCQYFLARFKGVAILPSDLLAMPTAFKVKEGYAFVLDSRGLLGPAACCIALAALSLLGQLPEDRPTVDAHSPRGRHSAQLVGGPSTQTRRREGLRKAGRFVLNLAIGAALAACVGAAVVVPSYIKQCGVTLDYGNTLESYKKSGFLTGFVAALQDLPITAPEGYTRVKAAGLQVSLDESYQEQSAQDEQRTKAAAQFESDQPSIIVVMNESFADLSIYGGLGADYKGPEYFKSINNALVRGPLATSVIGGGTCNTEFEFLTGNSYAFVGAGKYPFVTYRLRRENLASQLSSLGYATTAIHPNDPTNWNRNLVYADMGFDQFLDISAFEEDADQLHMGVTDAVTYDKILEILQLDPSPQFIFDVTMQNHGSYNLGNIPEDKLVSIQPGGAVEGNVTQEDTDALNEYLSCIKASDQDLKAFIDALSKLDRKVVLVFFGDHQPAFTPLLNDLFFADEQDAVAHLERVYQTEYAIWANYDVAGREQKSAVVAASPDALGARMLDLIGAPVSSYQQARLVVGKDIAALNAFGYLGADGTWYARDDANSPYAQAYLDYAYLNYLNFGSKAVSVPLPKLF